ncbi:hypothetical protein [Lacinutrix jangbogonensis]|uniref:hypothetical protein n=1 Tax=Lacinutrix jangbogonensis TaxID=1469557 RepID=UPI00053E5485|nr:hypothetical protein [Lacinutrix jangbogonensis]
MKNTYIKLLALLFIASASVSCVNDDETFGINDNKATATTSVTSLSLAEGESGVIPFTLSNAINKPSQFKIELVGGNGGQDDITAGDGYTDADTGIYQDGFEITVPAYVSSFEIPVNAVLDLDQTEGNETLTLKISAAGVRTILTPKAYIVEVSIQDYEYCMWELQVMDGYADSWQGATITFTDDNQVSVYPDGDWDDDAETYQIPVGRNGNFSITYLSGSTGDQPNAPGAPGYEEENSYTLTAPNGTVFSDGPVPTVGVIASGTGSLCN